MKKIILVLALALAPIFSNAQSIFNRLENLEGVDMIVVNKDAFELLNKFKPKDVNVEGNDVMQAFEMLNELKEFKMFSTDDFAIANKMESMVNSAIKSGNLTELMRIKEDDSRIKIYVKATKNKDFVSEVLMFVKGIDKKTNGMSEAMVLSLLGNIDINKMADFTDKIVKENR